MSADTEVNCFVFVDPALRGSDVVLLRLGGAAMSVDLNQRGYLRGALVLVLGAKKERGLSKGGEGKLPPAVRGKVHEPHCRRGQRVVVYPSGPRLGFGPSILDYA